MCVLVHGQSRSDSIGVKKTVSIPFVGCPSFGQAEVLEAPKGSSKLVSIDERDAEALSYYKSSDGISVLAPRSWFCQGVSGSGGAALFLSPLPIVHNPSGWTGLSGAAIEVNSISGENSGRYDIAELIGRIFPVYRSFARSVWDFDLPLPSRPFPKDTLAYRGHTVVEYKTPAHTDGLGNFNSWLGKNDLPITGVAILHFNSAHPVGDIPRLVLLSVRMSPELRPLARVIVRYAEAGFP